MKNISSTSPSLRGGAWPNEGDTGAIHSLEPGRPGATQSADLSSAEYQLSVPQAAPPSRQLSALTNILGKGVTTGNPVWTSAALPGMRSLQKMLVDHSLKLPKDDRADCLNAIMVVEDAVKMRLRLQQMRENDAEMATTQDRKDKDGERV